ncbi:MAG: TMEM43 family protein [Hyphomicrobiales bacterium]
MSDSFTETTTISWFSRIKSALIGIVIGLALVVGSIAGIFWNEHRAVQTARSLAQGRGLVVDVDAQKPDPANNAKLVHVAGTASVTQPLLDADFGVSATALRLRRIAEMYQWKEEEKTETTKNAGGSETKTTTYTYAKTWSAEQIDSGRFRHPQDHGNPAKTIAGRDFFAQDAKLGGFALDQMLLAKLPDDQRLAVPQDIAASLKTKNPDAQVSGDGIYIGQNPAEPRIGDVRISYQLTPAGALSVIAAQSGTGFQPFQTEAGDKLELIRPGIMAAPQMFAAAEEENTILTWALRAALMIAIWIGSFLCVRPLAVFADLIPFIGSMVGFGLGFIALLATLIIAPVAIAIAWFAFRPVAAVAVLVVGALLFVGLHRLRAGRTAKPAAAQPAR